MSKKKILITWPLPDAVMARARETYDVIAHGDNPKITIDEMLETAKSVDAILLTLNEKCRADVIALPGALQFGGWLGLVIVGALALQLYRVGTRR